MRIIITSNVIRESWQRLIANVERYFPGCRVNDGVWEILISKNRQWAFDMANKVWCNANGDGEYVGPYHPAVGPGMNKSYRFFDAEDKRDYRLVSRRYINGITCLRIFIDEI